MAVRPVLVSVPQPEEGLKLQLTPALVESPCNEAVSVTGGLPAGSVEDEPDWVTETLIATCSLTLNSMEAWLEGSATEVAVMVALQVLVSAAGGVQIAVDPAAVSAPQPLAGLMLQVTPALRTSLVTEAFNLTAEVPANTTLEVPDCVIDTDSGKFVLVELPLPHPDRDKATKTRQASRLFRLTFRGDLEDSAARDRLIVLTM